MKRFLLDHKFILCFILLALIGFALLCYWIILPSYTDSSSRIYTSKLGHPNILRKSGQPLPVKVTLPSVEKIEYFIMGEGTCSSQPILVPIIPMSVINEVFVKEGDSVSKGQLLATLDDQKAQIKYRSAKLAVSTAEAELERVQLGSAYVLAQERPEVEKINLEALKKQQVYAKETLERYETAYQSGVVSKVTLLEARAHYSQISEQLDQALLSTKMAERGVQQSLKIAKNAVDDAKQALAHREAELKSFQILAPEEGLIDRVLIQPGEYNQDSGKPGFLISNGLWFDAYFDQSDFPYIKKDLQASISLESYSGREFPAQVTAVKPVVSFNSGGPEISRPLRPRGSGSPEWAATFKTRLAFQLGSQDHHQKEQIITGMTGFARLQVTRKALTVPRSAVLSISAGSALLYVIKKTEQPDRTPIWEIRPVQVGHVDEKRVEILSGLTPHESVIIDGHWTLKKGDSITIQSQS